MGDEPFATAVPLDDSEMYLCGVEVIGYMDSEGGQGYRVRVDSDVPLSTALGLLELAKMQLLAESDWQGE